MEAEGMVVGAAGDGLEAIQLADERRPDVVLMDLRMPGMGGSRPRARSRIVTRGCRWSS